MNVILLSGGSGKRLWPLSNDVRSKQFIKIFKTADGSYESMLQRMYRQILMAVPDANITVAANKGQVASIHSQLGDDVSLSVEPERKGTFPAIALATAYLADKRHCSLEEPVVVCPVDTFVEDDYFALLKQLSDSVANSKDRLAMIGIKPVYPSAKYGYILPENTDQIANVGLFLENLTKPEAQSYIDKGALWNSGVFAFRLGYMLQKAREILGSNGYDEIHSKYGSILADSFDHAVAGREKNAITFRYTGEWKDLGTWNTLTEGMTKNTVGKATMDDTCSNVHILNEMDVPVLAMGLKDVVVAVSPEGILVSDKDSSAHITPYVDGIEQQVRFAEKSWGKYQVLHVENDSMTVLVTLRPSHYMAYHSHTHRDETWTVLSGYGHVIIDDKYINIKAGDAIAIKAGTRHTVFADTELELIENQIGKDISAADKIKYDFAPDTKCFGSLDIRGVYPTQVNEQLAYRIGRYYPGLIGAKRIVVGHDIRLSCGTLKSSLLKGLMEVGCDVIDIGQCGTEMVYFTTFHNKLDGGIMITASHNPKDYNGFKFVTKEAVPVGSANGLKDLEKLCENEPDSCNHTATGNVTKLDIYEEYIRHLMGYIDVSRLKPLRIVANTGNGAAGPLINLLEQYLPFEFIKVHNRPDGHFPNGVPNPLLYENREVTAKAVVDNRADIGIAWDGDFDRCFLFDENGNMVEGYYMVGLLAESFLKKNPGARIIHDPRVYWNTQDICRQYNGEAIISRSGHSNIKRKMREVDAVYGGEMSSHHYFRDFNYCDNGMIPWLLVVELMCDSNKKLSEMVETRIRKFPISGEINTKLHSKETASKILDDIKTKYANSRIDTIDGLSISFDDWRFNVRKSNTEPLIRLNVEAWSNRALLEEKTNGILSLIRDEKYS